MTFNKPMNDGLHFIFDFDGTLVDSFRVVIRKFNFLADKLGFQKVDEEKIEYLRELSSRGLIQYFKVPIYKLPQAILKIRKELKSEMQQLSTFQGLPEVLRTLYNKGVALSILTSNSSENVMEWLKSNRMDGLFKFIYTEASYFGKKRVLKKIIKSYDLDKLRTFYLGDETRDMEAAKECGIGSIAVTWGFNSEKILSQCQPHYIVRKPEDILTIFAELSL